MPIALAFGCGRATAQADTTATQASASTAKAPSKKSHSVSGSPLDTLRSTHLWTDTAPAQDFVRDSRPDAKALDYAPLNGAEPVRPKPRDAANVMALRAELEHDKIVNEGKGRRLGPVKPARKAAAR